VHSYGIENEIPGKCSNANSAQRHIVSVLEEEVADFDITQYFMTNFDTDTRFQADYLELFQQSISSKSESERMRTVWQPILFYNWGL
jgi:hypothetical protein